MGLRPVWRVVAVLYILINVGGVAWATVHGEAMHAALHVALLIAGGAGAMWWRGRQDGDLRDIAFPAGEQRLENLQQSVDAVALEVERIGEAQRFSAKLQAERAKTQP